LKNTKYLNSTKAAQFLHLACQGGRLAPLLPRQLRHWLRDWCKSGLHHLHPFYSFAFLLKIQQVLRLSIFAVAFMLCLRASAETFSGGKRRHFAYHNFRVADDANRRSQNVLPFPHHKANAPFYGNSHNNALHWSNYDNLQYYTIGVLQIFQAGTSFQITIAMFVNERSTATFCQKPFLHFSHQNYFSFVSDTG